MVGIPHRDVPIHAIPRNHVFFVLNYPGIQGDQCQHNFKGGRRTERKIDPLLVVNQVLVSLEAIDHNTPGYPGLLKIFLKIIPDSISGILGRSQTGKHCINAQ